MICRLDFLCLLSEALVCVRSRPPMCSSPQQCSYRLMAVVGLEYPQRCRPLANCGLRRADLDSTSTSAIWCDTLLLLHSTHRVPKFGAHALGGSGWTLLLSATVD